jgi:predicted  nucleic acid-binding Zn-ribbon protein
MTDNNNNTNNNETTTLDAEDIDAIRTISGSPWLSEMTMKGDLETIDDLQERNNQLQARIDELTETVEVIMVERMGFSEKAAALSEIVKLQKTAIGHQEKTIEMSAEIIETMRKVDEMKTQQMRELAALD